MKEFIDLVNHMDLAYRTELRDQNEANFQKFEAVLRAEMAALETRLVVRIDGVGARVDGLEGRIDGLEARIGGKMEAGFASLRVEMAAGQANMLKWMVFLFLGAVLTVVGLG